MVKTTKNLDKRSSFIVISLHSTDFTFFCKMLKMIPYERVIKK